MSEGTRRILVAYDVCSDARRDRVAVVLQSYGNRVQYSVFLVDAKAADLVRLSDKLRGLIDPLADRVLLCDLGPVPNARSRITHLGRMPKLTGDEPALIV